MVSVGATGMPDIGPLMEAGYGETRLLQWLSTALV